MKSDRTQYTAKGRRLLADARSASIKASQAELRCAEIEKTKTLRALRLAGAGDYQPPSR
jgi:hypothetical protein